MKQPKYILYTRNAWANGLPHLSTHDTREQAQQAALALIRSAESPGAVYQSEACRLATGYVIAYGEGNGREYGLPTTAPACPKGLEAV